MDWKYLDQNEDGSISLLKCEKGYMVKLSNDAQILCIESKSKSKLNDLFDLLTEKNEDDEEIFSVE